MKTSNKHRINLALSPDNPLQKEALAVLTKAPPGTRTTLICQALCEYQKSEAFVEKAEVQIKTLTKLSVQKKKRQHLFQALTDEEALAPAKRLYDQGHSGMEAEAQQYMEAVKLLDSYGASRESLSQQQAELYTKLAYLNRELRQVRKQLKMCEEIRAQAATMQENIREIEAPEHQRQSRHRGRA